MQRKLTTIMIADLVSYSAMMAADEERVVARLHAVRAGLVDPEIELADGRIVKSMGDGLLVEFASPVAALRCALQIQEHMAALGTRPGDPDLQYRIGLHLGDVVLDGDDILGDGVNIAARLEALAPAGGICLSRTIHDQINGKITAPLRSLGPQTLKNIPDPIEVWVFDPATAPAPPSQAARQKLPSLVVLPFSELGPPVDDFLCDGIVEEITAALSCVADFAVIARQSAFAFRDQNLDVREIGRQLGARYVVTGSVRRSGARLRISVQLSDSQSGGQIYSERYDDQLEDLFDLQDRIAARVAGAISPSIRASEIAQARALPSADRGAYSLYMSALPHFWAHRGDENERAITLLTEALKLNPDEVRARALRGWCYAQQATYMWSKTPLVSRAHAIADIDKAALIANDHAPSLVAIAASLSMVTTDNERARILLQRALSLDPNSAWGWMRSGWNWVYLKEPSRALADFDRAEALSPRDPFMFNLWFGRSVAHSILGEHETAIAMCRHGLTAGPGVTWAYRELASFLAQAGQADEADKALGKLLDAYPGLTLKRVRDSMPPSFEVRYTVHFDGLRRAGVPEE